MQTKERCETYRRKIQLPIPSFSLPNLPFLSYSIDYITSSHIFEYNKKLF